MPALPSGWKEPSRLSPPCLPGSVGKAGPGAGRGLLVSRSPFLPHRMPGPSGWLSAPVGENLSLGQRLLLPQVGSLLWPRVSE